MNIPRLKEHHPTLPKHPGKQLEDQPALPKHPGKQLEDQPPQQMVRHCGSCIIAPITSGSCNNPPFCRDTTCHRKWVQRATPQLLCHRVDESLFTYTAASHPRTRGVPPKGMIHEYKETSWKISEFHSFEDPWSYLIFSVSAR
ncbi:hypothetical protein AVEN_97753-1 [Araneus ventricosus]|uniref:Uncharacterized protein n=1 Tax=Araneus ventricosus TaxID=182803 RepID=A0A4Y2E4V6_ARAVE|nr:hypothetical protein AVEN_97753-1 [Araneus ventricosus]